MSYSTHGKMDFPDVFPKVREHGIPHKRSTSPNKNDYVEENVAQTSADPS